VKWKNIDIGAACYYITGTVTEWLPLLIRDDIRLRVCDDIKAALDSCGGSLVAFVIIPDHLHLLVHLPADGLLHRFVKQWRGRSGRHIPRILERQMDEESLRVLESHANGGCRYAVWKEHARALPIWGEEKLRAKMDYIHANPLRRGLVTDPGDWPHSSYRRYEGGEDVCLPVRFTYL
jgi:putative transposase